MTRTRKWVVGIAGTLVGAALICAIAIAWLAYTSSGLRFALDRGAALTDGAFAYTHASGTLADIATIDGLRYRTADGTTLKVDHATLSLRPWALLDRRLHVARARIDGVTLDLVAAQKPAQPSTPFSLKPPLAMTLDDIAITRITIRQNGKSTFAADSLTLSGAWAPRRLAVRKLALRASAGSVDVDGTLAIARGYRGDGVAHFDWTQAGTRYAGTLNAKSDGKRATLDARLVAPTAIALSGTVALDAKHAWTVDLDTPTFDARRVSALPAALQTLALKLDGHGDATRGTLTGQLTANGHTVLLAPAIFHTDGKTLTLAPLTLRAPDATGVATVTGAVHLDAAPLSATLDAQWRDVHLPADLVGQPLATHGQLHFDGNPERFVLAGALALGPPGKLADVKFDLAGTPKAIDLKALQLVQARGGLDAHGRVTLQPQLGWQIDAIAKQFDPGAIFAGWNGALNFNLASSGTLKHAWPDATLQLDRASGTLRGRTITGSTANLTLTATNLFAGTLHLVAGRSRIDATGQRGDRTNATIDLDIATLNDWLPGASGSIKGRISVQGTWPKLAVKANLAGGHLVDGTRKIDALQLTATLPNLAQPGGTLDLGLRGVAANGFTFDHITLTGSGNAAAHQLRLDATGKPLGLALALRGSWQAKTGRWAGTLADATLTPEGMPAWRQQQASAISWQRGALSLAQFCLSAGAPELCLAAKRDTQGALTARYTVTRLPLALLMALVPTDDALQASGDIAGNGQLTLSAKGVLGGNASLDIGAGQVAYAANPAQPLLAWTRLTAAASAAGAMQQVRIEGALAAGGQVTGNVSIKGAQHALAGALDADIRDLGFIAALSPEVASVHGSLGGQLTFGGTLAAPQFTGRIQTRDFSAEIPRAGLKLHAGQFAISGSPQGGIALAGQIASGQGVLHIDGHAGLAADAPLSVNLTGDNVLVADIPAAHVLASPDLHLTRAAGAFALTGSITIPNAKVAVEKLPGEGPSQASPDVVIVDAPPAKPVAPLALTADITVKLGDAVKLQGYGLDGSAAGQLAVRVAPGQTATGRGEIRIAGKYQAYGQNLSIERGRLLFAGTRLDDPGLDIRAVRALRSQDITVGLSVRGTAQKPVLTVFSTPAMEQAEALSYLVTGRPLNALKSGEGDTLNTAAEALGGLAGDRIAKSIGSRLGLDAGVANSEALGGSAFTAGKYLSPRLFLSYGVGLFTPGQVVTLRYTLNRFLQFEAENATTGNRASFNYRIEK